MTALSTDVFHYEKSTPMKQAPDELDSVFFFT